MVTPFRGVMRAGTSSFVVLAVVTYVISLFFWPTPAVPLVGAVLIPVAIRAGSAPLSVGMVIAIAGQGMALSSDYIIKVAPGISAKAAGVDTDGVADKAMVLSLIVGLTALAITYVMQRRTWRTPVARTARGLGEQGRPEPAIGRRNSDAIRGIPGPDGGSGWRYRLAAPIADPGGISRNKPQRSPAATATIAGASRWRKGSRRRGQAMWSAKVFAVLVPLVYLGLIVYLLLR